MLNWIEKKKIFKNIEQENIFYILSIDCVLISKLVFGSFAVESTNVVVVVVDDDADGDDDKPLWW